MTDPSRQPQSTVDQKERLNESRAGLERRSFARLRAPKGEICPDTADLDVKVTVVINQDTLTPLKGLRNTCNKHGKAGHDPESPVFWWFQDTPLGKELYLVLYTLPCEWGRCSFCTLPSESSPVPIAREAINRQARSAFDALNSSQRDEVRRLFLSNNGSILNTDTMPASVLLWICEEAHEIFPRLGVICLETRFETVDLAELLGLQHWFRAWHNEMRKKGLRKIAQPVRLQISAGYETQDPYLRDAVLCKGYPERKVQEFFAMCATLPKLKEMYKLKVEPVLVDEYVMLKPASGMTDEDAIAEAVETILHLQKLGEIYGVEVSVRLNPTFASVGSELFLEFERDNYRPPTYRDVFAVVRQCHDRGLRIPLFLGLNDEGLAYSMGSFGNRDGSDPFYRRALTAYNAHRQVTTLCRELQFVEEQLLCTAPGLALVAQLQAGIRDPRELEPEELIALEAWATAAGFGGGTSALLESLPLPQAVVADRKVTRL